MGFNLGVALGAGVKTGMDTYTTLAKEDREQKVFDAWQKEQNQKEALTQAAADTYGQVGQNKYDNVEALLAQQGTGEPLAGDGQGQVGADGKPVPVQAIPAQVAPDANGQVPAQALPAQAPAGTTAYTRDQADADFTKRAYGINFDMGRKAEREGLDISNARRVDARGKAEDEFSTWSQNSLAQIQKDPVQWAHDNLKDYNNPAKGSHLDDGLTAAVVKGADGSSSLVQKDTKGKIMSSTPINSDTAMAAFKEMAFAKYQALPGKFKEGMELNLKGREVKAKEDLVPSEIAKNMASVTAANASATTAKAHQAYYEGLNKEREAGNWSATMYNPETGDVGYTNPKKPGEFNDIFGKPIADATGYKPKEFKENPINAQEREYSQSLVSAGTIDPQTGKPYTRDGAKVKFFDNLRKAQSPEGQADAGFQKLQEKMITAGTPPAEQQAMMASHYNSLGIAPPVIRAAMQAGVDPTTGQPFTDKDIKELSKKYPTTARGIGFGGNRQAIPVGDSKPGAIPSPAASKPAVKEDTTKYAREKSPRGTYTYSPSPRGLTKAQYAEIDAAQKK